MRRQLLISILLTLALPACDLIYPRAAVHAPEVETSPRRPETAEINPQVKRPMQPRPIVGGVCHDNAAIRLLASGQYESANGLLQKAVNDDALAKAPATEQYCTYLGLNLLHLLSASPYFNLANAVEYQNRLQALIEEGISDEQGLLLSKALQEVMLQHTANSRLQTNIVELRAELQQKEDAIQRLKELTMEETGS